MVTVATVIPRTPAPEPHYKRHYSHASASSASSYDTDDTSPSTPSSARDLFDDDALNSPLFTTSIEPHDLTEKAQENCLTNHLFSTASQLSQALDWYIIRIKKSIDSCDKKELVLLDHLKAELHYTSRLNHVLKEHDKRSNPGQLVQYLGHAHRNLSQWKLSHIQTELKAFIQWLDTQPTLLEGLGIKYALQKTPLEKERFDITTNYYAMLATFAIGSNKKSEAEKRLAMLKLLHSLFTEYCASLFYIHGAEAAERLVEYSEASKLLEVFQETFRKPLKEIENFEVALKINKLTKTTPENALTAFLKQLTADNYYIRFVRTQKKSDEVRDQTEFACDDSVSTLSLSDATDYTDETLETGEEVMPTYICESFNLKAQFILKTLQDKRKASEHLQLGLNSYIAALSQAIKDHPTKESDLHKMLKHEKQCAIILSKGLNHLSLHHEKHEAFYMAAHFVLEQLKKSNDPSLPKSQLYGFIIDLSDQSGVAAALGLKTILTKAPDLAGYDILASFESAIAKPEVSTFEPSLDKINFSQTKFHEALLKTLHKHLQHISLLQHDCSRKHSTATSLITQRQSSVLKRGVSDAAKLQAEMDKRIQELAREAQVCADLHRTLAELDPVTDLINLNVLTSPISRLHAAPAGLKSLARVLRNNPRLKMIYKHESELAITVDDSAASDNEFKNWEYDYRSPKLNKDPLMQRGKVVDERWVRSA